MADHGGVAAQAGAVARSLKGLCRVPQGRCPRFREPPLRANLGGVSPHHRHLAMRLARRPDSDLDILSQIGKKIHQPLHCKAPSGAHQSERDNPCRATPSQPECHPEPGAPGSASRPCELTWAEVHPTTDTSPCALRVGRTVTSTSCPRSVRKSTSRPDQ